MVSDVTQSLFTKGYKCKARGALTYERGWDVRNFRETNLGVAKAFLTPQRHQVKILTNTYFYISSRATLDETIAAKYNGVLPRTT